MLFTELLKNVQTIGKLLFEHIEIIAIILSVFCTIVTLIINYVVKIRLDKYTTKKKRN